MTKNQPTEDLAQVIALTKRRCRDKKLLGALLVALKHPDLVRARQTTAGLLVVGPHGSATVHYTGSDHRTLRNTVSDLRRAGLYPSGRI